LWVKRRIREVKMDFPRNPSAKFSHRDGLGPLVLEDGSGGSMMREAFLQGAALVVGLQACDLERMGNRQLGLVERLLRFWNKLNQAQSPADVCGRPANAASDGFHSVGVGLQLNERGVSLRFIERMHVHSLDVLNDL
jgi:hypothetical protein